MLLKRWQWSRRQRLAKIKKYRGALHFLRTCRKFQDKTGVFWTTEMDRFHSLGLRYFGKCCWESHAEFVVLKFINELSQWKNPL